MEILDGREANNWVKARAWLRLERMRAVPTVPARIFQGAYDLSGTVAAGMAEMFLTELPRVRVSRGLVNIVRIFPPDRAPLRVFHSVLKQFGGDPAPGMVDGYGCLCDDYDALLTVLSWCLCCEWEIDFVASDLQFAFRSNEGRELTVFWPEDELVSPVAVRALLANQYTSVTASAEPPGAV